MMPSNGDPKIRLTVVLSLLGMLAGAVATYISVRVELKDAVADMKDNTATAVEKHAATGNHPTLSSKEDVREIKRSIDEMDAKVDRLIVDVAELKARKGKDR